MLSEKNLITNVNDISEYFKVNAGDTILISRPVYHAAVLTGEFLLSIIKGMDIVFYSQAFNPKLIVDILKKYKITTFAGTPTILTMLSDILRDINLYSIKNIVVSGECMQKDTAEKLLQNYKGVNIYHVYGLTEASPRVSYLEPALFKSHPCSVGVPLKSVEIKILDDSGLPVDDRQEGILWIKGESVMLGYYNMPELTASKLRGRWLCTGDIAYFKDNMLYIKCRSDDLIIRAGMNIYPQEIESELKKDTRVKEVLVYGCQSKFGTQIVLEICGDFNSEKEVIKLCSERLSPYQIPQTVRIVKSIAKSASGKVIRLR